MEQRKHGARHRAHGTAAWSFPGPFQHVALLFPAQTGPPTSGTEKRVSRRSKKVPEMSLFMRRPTSDLAVPGGPTSRMCSPLMAASSSSRTWHAAWGRGQQARCEHRAAPAPEFRCSQKEKVERQARPASNCKGPRCALAADQAVGERAWRTTRGGPCPPATPLPPPHLRVPLHQALLHRLHRVGQLGLHGAGDAALPARGRRSPAGGRGALLVQVAQQLLHAALRLPAHAGHLRRGRRRLGWRVGWAGGGGRAVCWVGKGWRGGCVQEHQGCSLPPPAPSGSPCCCPTLLLVCGTTCSYCPPRIHSRLPHMCTPRGTARARTATAHKLPSRSRPRTLTESCITRSLSM